MDIIANIKKDLEGLSDPATAEFFPRFFKTLPGGYAEGDVFVGVSVPNARAVARKYRDLPISQVNHLLHSGIHEHRLTALLILVDKFTKADPAGRAKIVRFYLGNLKHINNWDLVDLSADKILGAYLFDKGRTVLYELSDSGNLWSQRVSIMSTFFFIRNGQFDDTFRLAERMLNHT
ncbi:MAG: DNA alkylation repair protein, partial [Nitrospirota bacterium]